MSPDFLEYKNLGYVPVPKCMSTKMRETLGWQQTVKLGDVEIFGIVREPIDRWIAGMAQTFHHKKEEPWIRGQKTIQALDTFTEKVCFPWPERPTSPDIHTAKQVWFYGDASVTYFRLDQLNLLVDWLAARNCKIQIPDRPHPVKEKEQLRTLIKKSLTKEHLEKLRAFYAEDIKLYEGIDAEIS